MVIEESKRFIIYLYYVNCFLPIEYWNFIFQYFETLFQYLQLKFHWILKLYFSIFWNFISIFAVKVSNIETWQSKFRCRHLEVLTPLGIIVWRLVVVEIRNGLHTNTEKSFRNLINSNRNQIVFSIFNDWFGIANGHCPFVVPNQSRKMVNTIWFRFDSIRFRKDFSVCILSK